MRGYGRYPPPFPTRLYPTTYPALESIVITRHDGLFPLSPLPLPLLRPVRAPPPSTTIVVLSSSCPTLLQLSHLPLIITPRETLIWRTSHAR